MKFALSFLLLFIGTTVLARTYNLEILLEDAFENPQKSISVELEYKGMKFAKGTTNDKGIVSFKNLKLKKFWINIIQDEITSNQYYFENKKKANKRVTYFVHIAPEVYKEILSPLVDAYILSEMNKFGYRSHSELPDSSECNDEIFPDLPASFYNGNRNMMRYIQQSLTYPIESIKNEDQGKVYVAFIVTRAGYIIDVKVERGVSNELDREAVRVISEMPRWMPAICQGVPMDMKCRLPIVFTLE